MSTTPPAPGAAGRADAKAASRLPRAIRSTGAIRSSTTQPRSTKELERVFDICHGCRRCFSLCNSFPTLFDAVDASADGEVRRRRQEGLLGGRRPLLPVRHVLHDQVSVRAAASLERRLPAPDAARQGGAREAHRGCRCASACWPPPTRSAASPASRWSRSRQRRERLARRARAAGEDAGRGPRRAAAEVPRAQRRARRLAALGTVAGRRRRGAPQRPRADTTGRVALFTTCYGNRNEPELDEDLAAVFEHNGIERDAARTGSAAAACRGSSSVTSRRWRS